MPEKFDIEKMRNNILKKMQTPKTPLIQRLREVARKPKLPRLPRI